MNLDKLKKHAKLESEEKLFGISSYSTGVDTMLKRYANDVASYDEDSVSSLISACDEAEGYLDEAAQEVEVLENTLIEWRDLALAMWEDLDKDDQQQYVSFWSMTDEQKQRVHAAFKLEDLKKL